MEIPIFPDTPYVVKMLVWIAMGTAAVVFIVRQLKTWGILERIGRELTGDNRESLKEKVLQAAEDSKTTVEMILQLRKDHEKLDKYNKKMRRELSSVKISVSEIKDKTLAIDDEYKVLANQQEILKVDFNRRVVHDVNGTLFTSKLFEEAKVVVEEANRKNQGELPDNQGGDL